MKFRFTLLFLFSLGCIFPVSGGQYFTKKMVGTINGDTIDVFLQATDTLVVGYYAARKQPDYYFLFKGTVGEWGHVTMNVSDTAGNVIGTVSGRVTNSMFDAGGTLKIGWPIAFSCREDLPPAGTVHFSYTEHFDSQHCPPVDPSKDSCHTYQCKSLLIDNGMMEAAKINVYEDLSVVCWKKSLAPKRNKPALTFDEVMRDAGKKFLAGCATKNGRAMEEQNILVRTNNHGLISVICSRRNYDIEKGWTLHIDNRNYSIATGDTIALSKIFTGNYQKILADSLQMEVCRIYDIDPKAPLSKAGFKVSRIPITHNFYITEDSIVFYYNVGDISTDSVPLSVPLPFSQVKHLIDPKGPLAWAISK